METSMTIERKLMQLLNEEFKGYVELAVPYTSKNGLTTHLPVYKNPTSGEIYEIINEDENGSVRLAIDANGNWYAWPAGYSMHKEVEYAMDNVKFSGMVLYEYDDKKLEINTFADPKVFVKVARKFINKLVDVLPPGIETIKIISRTILFSSVILWQDGSRDYGFVYQF